MTPQHPRVAHVQAPSWSHPWLEDVLTRLPGRGWHPVAITIAPAGPLHRSLLDLSIPSLALDCGHRREYLMAAVRLARALRDVDVVHAHMFDAALVSTVAGAIARKPVVITRHEGPSLVRRAAGGGPGRKLYYLLDRVVLARAAAVIAPSGAVRDDVLALGARVSRVRSIRLGTDMDRLAVADPSRAAALRRELAGSSRFVALTVGRFSWEKQIDVLLSAWKMVREQQGDAVLLIAGEGPERARLERMVRELGITAAVRFIGWRSDVPELMRAADVVAHASAIESTGLVLLEALALARPLVTTPVGVANDYLVDGLHCTVVPHNDPSALARALLRVANDPSAAAVMAATGREKVRLESSVGPMVDAYAYLYDQITDVRGSGRGRRAVRARPDGPWALDRMRQGVVGTDAPPPAVDASGWVLPRHDVTVLGPRATRFALIVPVWNEGARFERQLREMEPYTSICDVVISDAPSTDGSTAIEKLRAGNVHAVVSLTEPGGLSASVRAAIAYALTAGFDGVILIDGNGKDDPEGLVRFVAHLEEGADYAQGSRYMTGGRAVNTPISRTLLIRLLHAPVFSLLCGRWFSDTTIGFRAFSRRFLLDPRVRPFRSQFEHYEIYFYLAWAACRYGFRVTDVPVTRAYPATGPVPTKITLFRGNWRMLKPLLMIMLRRY